MSNQNTELSTSEICDKACEILQQTNDGDKLDPNDLYIIQEAANWNLSEEGRQYFLKLHNTVVIEKNYSKPFLAAVEHMTSDHDGYVYYKENMVEHYSFNSIAADQLKIILQSLQQDCIQAESLGLPISIRTISDKSLWENIKQPFHPFLFFVLHGSAIYIKGDIILSNTTHSPTDKPNILKYKYTEINTRLLTTVEKEVIIEGIFYHWAIKQRFTSITNFHKQKEAEKWISKNNLKLWLLNPEKYWDFMLTSIKHGNIIEIPESTYDHFLGAVPPLTMNHQEDSLTWFINSEPNNFAEKGTTYFAGARVVNKYFAKQVTIPYKK